MAKTIQVELAAASCKAGIGYAQKHLTTSPKDAVICCEGMCLKGETARRAANMIAHELVPDRSVRICHGGLLEEAGGMRDLVQRANRVLVLDGCGMACGTRLTKGAFPDLEPEVVFTNQLYESDPELFGVDEVPDSQISENSRKVAEQVVQKYF
jgi:uncharacterized metal-binding protein